MSEASPPATPLPASDRFRAAACHAVALIALPVWWLGIVIPGANVVGPLMLRLIFGSASPFVARHAAAALNFHLTAALIGIPLTLISFSRAGTVVVWLFVLAWIGMVGWAIRAALVGKPWAAPACLPVARAE